MSLTLLKPALNQEDSHSGYSRSGYLPVPKTDDHYAFEYYADKLAGEDENADKIRLAFSLFMEFVASTEQFADTLIAAYDTIEDAGDEDANTIKIKLRQNTIRAAAATSSNNSPAPESESPDNPPEFQDNPGETN